MGGAVVILNLTIIQNQSVAVSTCSLLVLRSLASISLTVSEVRTLFSPTTDSISLLILD